ncbi:MAG: response regulator, partial [Candidatus Omnitrophota bacterium]
PDIILLDLLMPGEDGASVAAQIRMDEQGKNLPIIFLTGTITKEEAMEQQEIIKGTLFLAKPVSLKELMLTIERCLHK